VELFHVEEARINTTRKTHFQVDGEYLGKTDHINAEILKNSLDLILPANR
jgi:diacylglycerol kinase family enzyme